MLCQDKSPEVFTVPWHQSSTSVTNTVLPEDWIPELVWGLVMVSNTALRTHPQVSIKFRSGHTVKVIAFN